MTVYVESNFVLEQALEQEQCESCDRIVALASAGRVSLVVPAYCLAEPYEAITRKGKARTRLSSELRAHLSELGRSKSYRVVLASLSELTAVLAGSVELEREGLRRTVRSLLAVAEVVSLDADVLRSASRLQTDYDIPGQDSIVLASVLTHLERWRPAESCFLSRNWKDFDDPDIVANLGSFGCRFFGQFDRGLRHIVTRTAAL